MKKNKKDCEKCWTMLNNVSSLRALIIIVIVCTFTLVLRSAEDDTIKKVEDQLQLALENEYADLAEKYALLQGKHEVTTKKLNKLESDNKLLQERLDLLHLNAASLLFEKEDMAQGRLLTLALKYLQEKDNALRDCDKQLKGLIIFAEEVDASQEMQTDSLIKRLKEISNEVERKNSIPSLVAKRDGDASRKCSVLTVENNLEIVVLDSGFTDGMRLGSMWTINDDKNESFCKLRIVEVRHSISAAKVVLGDILRIKSGEIVKAGK